MQRVGSVIVFKEGVNRQEAAEALLKIKDLIEMPKDNNSFRAALETVRTFDDEYGGPVWYIP